MTRFTAAEQDPRAVGRAAYEIDVVHIIEIRPVARQEAAHDFRRDRLGRDHIGIERDDAPPQPWEEATGISIGREEDIPRLDGASRGRQHKPVRRLGAAQPLDGRMADQHHSGRPRPLEEAALVEAGMDRAEIRNDRSAAEPVGRDLLMHRCSGHHGEFFAEVFSSELELGCESLVLPGRARHDETPATLEGGVDMLGLEAVHDQIEGRLHLAIHGDRMFGAVAALQVAKAVFEGASEIAGVARAGALPEIAGVEHGNAAPRPCQDQRGVQPGDAGADDRHVDRRRHGRWRKVERRRRLPPIRCLFEAGCEGGYVVRHERPGVPRDARSALSQRISSSRRASSRPAPSRRDQS